MHKNVRTLEITNLMSQNIDTTSERPVPEWSFINGSPSHGDVCLQILRFFHDVLDDNNLMNNNNLWHKKEIYQVDKKYKQLLIKKRFKTRNFTVLSLIIMFKKRELLKWILIDLQDLIVMPEFADKQLFTKK